MQDEESDEWILQVFIPEVFRKITFRQITTIQVLKGNKWEYTDDDFGSLWVCDVEPITIE